MTAPDRDTEWPRWPSSSPAVEGALLRVARSGRWAISGMNAGWPSEERAFADQFATYIGVEFGTPVTNGSAALLVALEAMGIGVGDEVLVPGLAWVACASAVARSGAIPVLVDVDETSMCMSVDAAAAAVTSRTAAILLVHLYSSLADVDAFRDLASAHGLAVLEDCSQAHGAAWRGRKVGSWGHASAFSFQNSKLLTAGEGGIVLTDDPSLHDRAQRLRSDGRRWTHTPVPAGFPELDESGGFQGHNYCMSEFHAAVLAAGLTELDDQNLQRLRAVDRIEQGLAGVDGLATVRSRDPRITVPTFYHLPIRLDAERLENDDIVSLGERVSARLGLFLEPVDPPMNVHPLYRPDTSRRHPAERIAALCRRADLPSARALSTTCITVPHHALLAGDSALDRLVEELANALDDRP